MKNILIVLIVMLLTVFSANAQWYVKKYQVTSIRDLNMFQLEESLKAAQGQKTGGIILIVAGSAATVVGSVLYIRGLNDIMESTYGSEINAGANKSYGGLAIAGVGLGMIGIGIPVTIVANKKENRIRIAMIKLKETSMVIPTFGVHINF